MSHGDPGRRLRPSLRPLIRPSATRSLVETHVILGPGFLQANSHNCLLSVTFSEVKKHETWLYLTHMESLHSPCWQTYEKKIKKPICYNSIKKYPKQYNAVIISESKRCRFTSGQYLILFPKGELNHET